MSPYLGFKRNLRSRANSPPIGKYLFIRRRMAKLSIEDAAERLGLCNSGHLSNIEIGRSTGAVFIKRRVDKLVEVYGGTKEDWLRRAAEVEFPGLLGPAPDAEALKDLRRILLGMLHAKIQEEDAGN